MPRRPRPTLSTVPPQLFGVEDAAAHLGTSINMLYKRTRAGEIRAVHWGAGHHVMKWRRSDLDAFIASLPPVRGPVRAKGVGLVRAEEAASA